VTAGDQVQRRFAGMIQGGWGDMLKELS